MKNKNHKAGQLFTYNKRLYQFKKATDMCKGCSLDSITMCPNIQDRRFDVTDLDCLRNGLILIRLQ